MDGFEMFMMENPIKKDDSGVPAFWETPYVPKLGEQSQDKVQSSIPFPDQKEAGH